MDQLRILIADDHPLFRVGLKYALKAQGFEVVAEVADGLEAIAATESLLPDVVLLDVKMPQLDGIEACKQIKSQFDEVVVIMLTTFEEPAIIEAARQSGAKGYLSKETDPADLAAAIRGIFDRPDANWLPQVRVPSLTKRETQVLELLAQGYSNKAIAKRLNLSPETVKDYLNGVYRKLEVSDRLSAVSQGQKLGLI